jgi:hypothetical protein
MVNNVIGVVNYVIAARPSLRNFMIADSKASAEMAGPVVCFSYLAAAGLWHVDRFPLPNRGVGIGQHCVVTIAADGPVAAAVLAAVGVPAQVLGSGLGAELRCGQQVTHSGAASLGGSR